MDVRALEEIGLTRGEAKVYLALFKLGTSTSGPIAKEAGISPSKVYPILEKLIKKGLVGVVIREGSKYFQAASPEKLLGFLEEKKARIAEQQKTIRALLPQLIAKKKKETKVFFYEGVEAVKNMYNEIYLTLKKGDEYLAYGVRGSPALRKADAFFQNWQMERGKKGIRGKIVYERDAMDIARRRAMAPLTAVRVLPENFKTPAAINIYGDKTAIILWGENAYVIIIESEDVANSFREYFKAIWKVAEPV